MPIYEYAPADEASCEHCESGFDAFQDYEDDALEACPECCNPVRRVFSSFAIGKSVNDARKLLRSKGWTQYNKAGAGAYEKVAGDGPSTFGED